MSFDGFELSMIDIGDVVLRVRNGGSGPPLLLLHGCPQTHMMWGKIAGDLANDFTVIAPDLRGYGLSSKPQAAKDGAAYSKRTMANDAIALMKHFGHERFMVAGHDRGGRVAYRLALDHPNAVSKVSILDIMPTGEIWARADHRFALGYWHWSFLAQPAPNPEHFIIAGGAESFFFDFMFRGAKKIFDADAMEDYRCALANSETIRSICDDYRAGAGFDRKLDLEQRGRAKISCPTQVLWGANGAVGAWYDVLGIWKNWTDDLVGEGLPCGHFLPEERPAETLAALRRFFLK
ncbi:MAG: alpha/beta hydrolase [Caulobacterales bacterium]